MIRNLLMLIALTLICSSAAAGQTTTATLSGSVTDQNDAVVPNVKISVISISQGFQRTTTTNGDGVFVVPLLPPGTYTVKAERTGFTTTEIRNVVLNVSNNVAIKVPLNVGDISHTVEVVEGASPVNSSATLATVVNRQLVENLPLNGRSFQSLISLTPGVTIAKSSNINTGQFSVNGQRTNTNYFSVDGVSANIGVSTTDLIGQEASGSVPGLTSFGGTNNLISIDALQEFSIQTSTFAPEFGRSPGAQISLVSRAGSPQLHGVVFDYLRNDVFDANDYFSNRAGLPKAELRQNQFGGVVGGPIVLPSFGEGTKPWLSWKNNAFFFFSYEGLRLRQPQTTITNVPSIRIRQEAPSNVTFILNAIPLPTGPEVGTTGRSPFVGTYSDISELNATSFRIDHNTNRWATFVRVNNAPSKSITRNRLTPSVLTDLRLNTFTMTAGVTHTFSAKTFNEFRFNWSRSSGTNISTLDSFGGAAPLTVSQLVPSIASDVQPAATVQFYTGSYTIGNNNDSLQRQVNLVNNFSRLLGGHNVKIGVDYRRLTPLFRARDYIVSCAFLTVAQVLAGRATVCQVVGRKATRPVFNNFSSYLQDTFQKSSRFNLTYGARWDINPPPTEATGLQAFAVATNDPLTTPLAPLGTRLWKTRYTNLAPRVGGSYAVINQPGKELVLRMGGGLFYDLGVTQAGDAYTKGPFRTTPTSFTNVLYPLTDAQGVLPAFPIEASTSQSYGFDPKLKTPHSWQANLTLQQSLGKVQTLSASYVASLGRNLLRPRIYNNLNPNFRQLQYIDNGSTSDYHSLQLQLIRRMSRNLQALASYTWSHAIDEISDETGNVSTIRGNADFDVRHNFAGAVNYLFPWRPQGLKGKLLRRWESSLTIHSQSAYPITPYTTQFTLLSSQLVAQYPNAVVGVPKYVDDPLVPGGRRINRAALVAPATGTQGNVGRNSFRGFPTNQVDLALQRQIQVNERWKLTLRGEAFNLFNHANFDTPIPDMSNTNFGQSTQMLGRGLAGLSPVYQLGGPRSLQLALRVAF